MPIKGWCLTEPESGKRAGEKAQRLRLLRFHARQSLPGRSLDTADVWMKRAFTLWVGPGSVGSVIGAFGNTTQPHGAPDLSRKTYPRYIKTASVTGPNTLAASFLLNRRK